MVCTNISYSKLDFGRCFTTPAQDNVWSISMTCMSSMQLFIYAMMQKTRSGYYRHDKHNSIPITLEEHNMPYDITLFSCYWCVVMLYTKSTSYMKVVHIAVQPHFITDSGTRKQFV